MWIGKSKVAENVFARSSVHFDYLNKIWALPSGNKGVNAVNKTEG